MDPALPRNDNHNSMNAKGGYAMSDIYLVGYDGSDAAHRALDFAISNSTNSGAPIILTHVLEWSPYKFLTPMELEERHKRRREELQRADEVIIQPVLTRLKEAGIEASAVVRYGHIAELIAAIAEETHASQIFIGRDGENGLSARVFGSVAGTLVQIAPVPCTIVP